MWFIKSRNLDSTPPEEKESIARLVKQNEVRLSLAIKRRQEITQKNHLGPRLLKAMERN